MPVKDVKAGIRLGLPTDWFDYHKL